MADVKFNSKKIERFSEYFPDELAYEIIEMELVSVISTFRNEKHEAHKTALRNYMIIRSVTLLEVYLQNLTKILIDDYDIPFNKLFEGKNLSVPLSKLNEITNSTKGKIVANILSFQSSASINENLSKLLGLNFKEKFESFGFFDDNKKWQKALDWNDFFELFEERHKLIHTLHSTKKYKLFDLRKIVIKCRSFTMLTNFIAFSVVYHKSGKLLKKKHPKIYDHVKNFPKLRS